MFLARQVYPVNSNSLYKAYLDATRRPHGYLLLDLSQERDDRLRFRTDIFPTEQTIVYSSYYHTLHVLKTAHPKLRKAIITNCNKELVNSISECILNVLNGNVRLSGCSTRKLRKYKALLRKVADKRLLRLLSAVLPVIASLIFSPGKKQ